MTESTWVLPSGVTVGREVVRERHEYALPKGTTMHITSVHRRDDDIVERGVTIGRTHGILWTPSCASASPPVPLILLGHPSGPGLARMRPRLDARARAAAGPGFASVAPE